MWHAACMAGGMNTRRDRLSLADRSTISGTAGPPPTSRHCWVSGLPDAPGRWPGLLVEWRRGEVWLARVVYALDSGEQTLVVEAWLSADHLDPVV